MNTKLGYDRGVSRWIPLVAVVVLIPLLAPGSAAQINGIPPSVTSIAPGRTVPNIAPSVTSLGPLGFSKTCCFGVHTVRPSTGHHHHPGRGNGFVGGVPVAVPVPVPVYTGDYPGYYDDSTNGDSQPEGEATPGPTIFEHNWRGAYPSANDEAGVRSRQPLPRAGGDETSANAAEPAGSASESNEPSSVLVFRDGHQQEVSNYAIIGDTLYDLSSGRAHKIPLAELDLDSTVRANDDRGIDFTLPETAKAPVAN